MNLDTDPLVSITLLLRRKISLKDLKQMFVFQNYIFKGLKTYVCFPFILFLKLFL
jgi:hypothetical protein